MAPVNLDMVANPIAGTGVFLLGGVAAAVYLLPFRGAVVRDSRAWSHYIAVALEKFGAQSDALIGQHHWPVWDSPRIIEYLKTSGLEIKEIKRFMQWVTEGPATYAQRKELFERRREAVLADIARLQKTLAMLEFKCWYYDTAIADGNEDRIAAMLPDKLPPDVQALYDTAHC